MQPSLQHLAVSQALAHFLTRVPATRRVLVGYSGGVDSHVLLHNLKQQSLERTDLDILAVHVNHGIQSQSGEWVNHCKNQCRALDVPVTCIEVDVSQFRDKGPEASARMARYGAFATIMREGDYLLLAQHADDQVETFLLQALRGSGPDGLASIPLQRPFAMGQLCRPLLTCYRSQILEYANEAGLHWIEDPSNSDDSLDRNHLRLNVIPQLKSRWPSLNQTITRSASRCGAASNLLKAMAKDDLDFSRFEDADRDELLHGSVDILNATRLASLGEERIFNTLRLWVRENGMTLPGLEQLRQVTSTLLQPGDEVSGLGKVHIGQYAFRRYQQVLHLCRDPESSSLSPEPDDGQGNGFDQEYDYAWEAPFAPLDVPEADVTLTIEQGERLGLLLHEMASVRVCNRRGGETLKLAGRGSRSIKKLLQEAGIPPWRRHRYPLLYHGDTVIALWPLFAGQSNTADTQ